ncbi:MAG: DUF2905 domain-containing protein [Bacillota bacterium]|nr:DUF2905 domain-containing protein [Bacillota bacterium]
MSEIPSLGPLGRLLMVAGAVLFAAGLALTAAGRFPAIGRLPGDIYLRRGNFVFYFPLTTGLLVSLLLTLVFRLLSRR